MSHFSRIQLDITHPEARAAINAVEGAGAHREHQWLWRFFADDPDATRDFVFRRMDPDSPQAHAVCYVVSRRAPSAPHPAWRVDTRHYDPQVATGQTLAFELRANPVVTRDGRRHDVVMDAKTALAREAGNESWAQMPPAGQAAVTQQGYAFIRERIAAWLRGTQREPGFAARHGFALAQLNDEVSELRVDGYRRNRLAGKDGRSGQAWFTSVDLAGKLVVCDREKFLAALHRGAGHAKAYGCGLLLIRPG